MIGHRLKFNGAYYGPSDEKLKEEYRKAEPFLSISGTSVKIGDGYVVPKVEMLKEVAEILGTKLDIPNLSNGSEELLKDLKDCIRDEIDTRCERWKIQMLEEEGINADSVYKCVNCGTDLKKNWKICPRCGKKVGFTTCDKCGETLSCDWDYCPKCGKKL